MIHKPLEFQDADVLDVLEVVLQDALLLVLDVLDVQEVVEPDVQEDVILTVKDAMDALVVEEHAQVLAMEVVLEAVGEIAIPDAILPVLDVLETVVQDVNRSVQDVNLSARIVVLLIVLLPVSINVLEHAMDHVQIKMQHKNLTYTKNNVNIFYIKNCKY